MITSTKNMLNSRFDMKDLGLADVILGIKIKRTLDGLILSQSHHVDNILRKFDKGDSKECVTPLPPHRRRVGMRHKIEAP